MYLKAVFITLSALIGAEAFASSSLPYIGPQQENCNVRTPGVVANDIDAGYLASEDCKTIYVLPPVEGRFRFGHASSTWDVKLCPLVNRSLDLVGEHVKKIETANFEEARKLNIEARELSAAVNSIGGDRVVSLVAGSAQLGWERIVQAYKTLNPNTDVRRLPIATGIFSTSTYAESDLSLSQPVGGVRKVEVHGLKLPPEMSSSENMAVPEYIKKIPERPGSVNILMGEGLGFNIYLTLAGACSLQPDARHPIAGTYTYFYPVQTKSFFRVALDENLLEREIMEMAASKNGAVNVDELYNKVSQSKSVEIVLNNGMIDNNEEVKRLEVEYKEDLTKFAIENVLAIVGSEMKSMVERATYIEKEARYQRVCKRRFLRSKKCHTNTYYVEVKKIDWNNLKQQLGSLLTEKNTKTQVNSYITFYMSGTTAFFAPQAEKTK